MNHLLTQLRLFIRDSINPAKFSGNEISPEDFKKWRLFLTDSSESFKQHYAVIYSLNRSINLLTVTHQLIKYSNTVSKYLVNQNRLWRTYPQADEIRAGYLYTCTILEDLIDHLSDFTTQSTSGILITDFTKPLIKMGLRDTLSSVKIHLIRPEIDSELSIIVVRGINQLMAKKDLTRDVVIYLKVLMERMNELEIYQTDSMIKFLLANDFNLPEFFLYCVKYWKNHLTELSGLHDQKEYLLNEKQEVYLISLQKGLKMNWQKSTLIFEINGFLMEQYLFVKQMLIIRREVFLDNEKLKNNTRFLINLPVPQFGLFIRMQIERGLLVKEHIGDLFTFFATHFYTPNTTYISADSLQKKSTDVEFATAQKLKAHLIGMLNWLNTHYNLSNYN